MSFDPTLRGCYIQFPYVRKCVRASPAIPVIPGHMPKKRKENCFTELLETVLERSTEVVAGGHVVWRHAALRISTKEGTGQVHRLWWIKRHGEIPYGSFLLNKCKVPGCIEPGCHFVSQFANMRDVERSHATPASNGARCTSNGPQETRCDGRR